MTERIPFKAKERFSILRRDNFTCRYCGRAAPGVELHVDHIIPVAEGGQNDEENLVTACQDCNLGKGAVPLESAVMTPGFARYLIENFFIGRYGSEAEYACRHADNMGWLKGASDIAIQHIDFNEWAKELDVIFENFGDHVYVFTATERGK